MYFSKLCTQKKITANGRSYRIQDRRMKFLFWKSGGRVSAECGRNSRKIEFLSFEPIYYLSVIFGSFPVGYASNDKFVDYSLRWVSK